MSEKTAEQIAAEQAEAQKKADEKAQKEALKAQKVQEAADKKAAAEAVKAQKKADADAAKQKTADEKAAKLAEKEALKAQKEQEKADKLAAKQAEKDSKKRVQMPEQNGVRRPGPTGLCGMAWSLFDSLSAAQNAPTSIARALESAKTHSPVLNDANVRTEYARWKKFNGLEGKIVDPVAPGTQAPAAEAAPA